MSLKNILLSAAVVSLVAATATVSRATLVSYYPLDETVNPSAGLTVADASGNGRNGKASTDVAGPGPIVGVPSVSPIYGTAYNLVGSDADYVYMASGASLSRDGALTYGAWVKPDPVANQGAFPTIVGTGGRSFEMRLVDNGSGGYNVQLSSFATPLTSAAVTNFVKSTGSIAAGVWTYIAITKDANGSAGTNLANVNIYIGGALDSTGTIGRSPISGNSVSMVIGQGAYGTQQYSGVVDEVRTYDEVLDASSISALAVVPEPASIVLAGFGTLGLACIVRRRRAKNVCAKA